MFWIYIHIMYGIPRPYLNCIYFEEVNSDIASPYFPKQTFPTCIRKNISEQFVTSVLLIL